MAAAKPDPVRDRLEARVLRLALDLPGEPHEERVGFEPADPQLALPVAGQAQDVREPEGLELEARGADGELYGSGEHRSDLRDGRLQVGSGHARRVDLDGQVDGERTLQRRERLHDRAGGVIAVELEARPRGDDDRRPPVEPQGRVAVAPVGPGEIWSSSNWSAGS